MRAHASIVVMLVVAGCADERRSAGSEVTVRVENGVTIVVNPGLHIADSTAWSIDTVGVVKIGMVDGPDEYVFGRLAGTMLLPNGDILVADAMAHELRIFDQHGKFLRRIGRRGDGPGEFDVLSDVQRYAADSLIVTDYEGGRANVLDPQLAYVRRYHPTLKESRATPPYTSHSLEGFLAGGRPVLSDFLNVCGERRSNGFCEDSVAFFATDEAGNTQARFGSFVSGRRESRRVEPGLVTGWGEPHPQAMWQLGGDRFYYADAKRFEILVFTSDGTLERRIRVTHSAPRYTREEVWLAPAPLPPARNARAERARAVLRDAQAAATLPDTFPSFSDLLVDDASNVWVREYQPAVARPPRPPRWFVFDPDGHLRWSVRSPPGLLRAFRPYMRMGPHITNNSILTTTRDADGVESVVVYRLIKRQ